MAGRFIGKGGAEERGKDHKGKSKREWIDTECRGVRNRKEN